ncbi:MAG TPA: hypothetical protein PKG63_02720 [Bacteroidales bacterium]|jgi:hypothetical protein|nr:hypothetical protein [Bacteroidales bacterium]HOU98522.1 hypothetical protein [Bacteroidales bacterium]
MMGIMAVKIKKAVVMAIKYDELKIKIPEKRLKTIINKYVGIKIG